MVYRRSTTAPRSAILIDWHSDMIDSILNLNIAFKPCMTDRICHRQEDRAVHQGNSIGLTGVSEIKQRPVGPS
jgi:hypothetical protein